MNHPTHRAIVVGVALLVAVLTFGGWVRGYGQEKDEQQIRSIAERFINNLVRDDVKALLQDISSYPEEELKPPRKAGTEEFPGREDWPRLVIGKSEGGDGGVLPLTGKIADKWAKEVKPRAVKPKVEITQLAVMGKSAFVTARVQVTDRPSRGALLLVKAKDGWKVFAVALED